MSRLTKLAASLLILVSAPCLADRCMAYRGEVELRGALSRHTFAEEPNYESIAQGDAAASYFFVVPSRPSCVLAGKPNENEPAEKHVERVQLVFPLHEAGYRVLHPYVGRTVVCRGSLMHAISGHHHSSVLLADAVCIGD
ncbi:hypothetical protein RCH09_003079 [Actimicrobium sp. GrIS 1.19]|uniref:DUF4431 domain-containing protein n=1 Tax=Actimicrobium sp. GrIS 1.19 TaxID=3071708 RepID=UPI002E03EC09|nr:hypothetical protein [Actimicrobium sp. GrIS 1.19]